MGVAELVDRSGGCTLRRPVARRSRGRDRVHRGPGREDSSSATSFVGSSGIRSPGPSTPRRRPPDPRRKTVEVLRCRRPTPRTSQHHAARRSPSAAPGPARCDGGALAAAVDHAELFGEGELVEPGTDLVSKIQRLHRRVTSGADESGVPGKLDRRSFRYRLRVRGRAGIRRDRREECENVNQDTGRR